MAHKPHKGMTPKSPGSSTKLPTSPYTKGHLHKGGR